MPTYNYYCKSCDANFHDLCSYDEREEKRTCSFCGEEQCSYTISSSKNRGSKGSGMAIVSDGRGGRKVTIDGQSHDAGTKEWQDRNMKTLIDGAESRVAGDVEGKGTGQSPYAKWVPDTKELVKQGQLRRLTDKEAKANREGAQRLAQQAERKLTEKEIDMSKHSNRSDG